MKTSSRTWLAAGLLSLAGAVAVAQTTPAAPAAPAAKAEAKPTQDALIFRNGTVLYGKVISQTPREVRFKGKTAGIDFETDYLKADILEIKRDLEVKDAAEAPKAVGMIKNESKAEETPDDGIAKVRYYIADLTGEVGEKISQTPLHKALLEARDRKADVVIFNLNADFTDPRTHRERNEFEGDFDKLHRATAIMQVLVNDMPVDFGGKPPRLVFWVKKAMGGAAYLPLVSPEIYFYSDGKLGGIGNLDFMMKGNERVVEKQISLRLQRATGWANVGGYPEEIVRAMARRNYVLSVKYVGGKPIFIEGYPKNPDEELLTDDGEGENADPIDALARGEGNDVLTLNATNAKKLLISKGTADTQEELLHLMGLDRTGVEVNPKKHGQVSNDWEKGLDNAMTQISKLWTEFRETQVAGDWSQRRNARNARITKIEQIKSLFARWGEGLNVYWMVRTGFRNFLTDEGEIDLTALTALQDALKIEQQKDKK